MQRVGDKVQWKEAGQGPSECGAQQAGEKGMDGCVVDSDASVRTTVDGGGTPAPQSSKST